MRRLLIATALSGLLAVPALAADPESGKISSSSPTVSWKGHIEGSSVAYALYGGAGQDPGESCEDLAPSCDTFTLTLADGPASVTLQAAAEGVNEINIALKKADGTVTRFSSDAKAKGTVKNLPNGDYPVYVWGVKGASSGSVAFDYTASAEMPAAAPAPAPGPAPGPAPTPGPAPGPDSAPPTLTFKAGKLSAKKVNRSRRVVVTLTAGAPVKNLVATLKSGSRTVGKAGAAAFEGKGTLALRLSRKLKAGTYSLSLSATDEQGRPVRGSGRLRLRR